MFQEDVAVSQSLPEESNCTTTQRLAQDATTMPRPKKDEITKWHIRRTQFDTDVMTICPAYPDFMITGTYMLVRKAEEHLYPGQFRHGTVFVNPVSPFWQPAFPGQQAPKYAKRKLPAAILDIHFHPSDETLMAVSLSDMTMHFFRFVKRADILSRRIITELLPLGSIKVSERDKYGCLVLLMQFRWLDLYEECGSVNEYTNTIATQLVVALSSGEIITVKARLPAIRSTFDPRLAREPATILFSRESVHWHDQEAWAAITMPISTTRDSQTLLLLSGGDDSKLMTSIITLDTSTHEDEHFTSPPQPLWNDSKSHNGGVTAILPIPAPVCSEPGPQPIPLLTGSYDETLRLFTLNPHTHRRQPLQPVAELHLRGGGWRIKLMDHYVTPLPASSASPPATSLTRKKPLPPHETHYLLIIAAMHSSAQVVRVTHTPQPATPGEHWAIKREAQLGFDAHESLVYDADARKEWATTTTTTTAPTTAPSPSPQTVTTRDTWDGALSLELEELAAKRFVRRVGVDVKWAEPRRSEDREEEDEQGERMTEFEKEQRERKVGWYTCLSAGFYDGRICTWAWRDERRREGVAVRDFLERY